MQTLFLTITNNTTKWKQHLLKTAITEIKSAKSYKKWALHQEQDKRKVSHIDNQETRHSY